jgi:hypothetical protein
MSPDIFTRLETSPLGSELSLACQWVLGAGLGGRNSKLQS